MWVTKRRFIVAGAAALAGGTVAAAAAIRKPQPEIFTPQDGATLQPAALQNATTLVPTNPAHPILPFSFNDANGNEHRIGEFAGLGAVVNFWATWCPPCVEELPALARLARLVSGEGIAVMALSVDRGGAAKVQGYFRDKGIEGLQVLVDPHGAASRLLGVRGIPTTILVDRAGRERARLEGPADWTAADLLRAVRRLTA